MLDTSEVELFAVCAHQIGNKMRQEGTTISKSELSLSEETSGALLNYFFNHFRNAENVHRLTHPAGRDQNAIYAISARIFGGGSLLEESAKASEHLYDVSDHPKIRGGDLYVARFKGLKFQGKAVEAVGFFKSDHIDRFLTLEYGKGKATVAVIAGTHLKSFDKGALVINRNQSDGYRVLQAVSQNEDAAYWVERFLKLAAVNLDSEHTKQVMRLCRQYADSLTQAEDPTERLQFLDSSFAYFSGNSQFAEKEFLGSLPKNLHDSFSRFRNQFEEEHNQAVPTNFQLAPSVLKKEKKLFRSVIRLDNHIEIKINPQVQEQGEAFIEKGFDRKRGQGFYKIYFNEEK